MATVGADYEEKIDELQKWAAETDSVPEQIDRTLLRRFYQCMYGDMAATKCLIEINYALRNKHTHIFIKRDPIDEDSRKTFEYADMLPLPGLTPTNYKVCFYRLCDFDPKKMHHTEDTKAFFMVADCRFCMPDVEDGDALSEGEVQIFDMSGYSMKHVMKMSVSTLRIYVQFLQEAYPVRLKAIHMINCPTYLDRIVSIVKPLISKEVFELIHFHTEGIESLYDHIPREMLPDEYGGQAGKIADLKAQVAMMLQEKRNYLMEAKHWKTKVITSNKNRWALF